jgi:hypothetical protein
MSYLPRVITVDPTFAIARIIRGTTDLLGYPIIQVDVPRGTDALDELNRGGASLIVAAWELHDDIQGLELALRVKQTAAETAVVLVGDVDDPESVEEETVDGKSPFVYLRRPVDIHQFLRVIVAGLKSEDIHSAFNPPASAVAAAVDHGPLPSIDVQNAHAIIKRMLVDVGAMAIILAGRTGEVLLEDGAPGYLDRESLTRALLPTVHTNIEMSALVGGQPQTIHFYDGDDKDVFVLSVGLHHFLCIVYDGQMGSRQFGSVTRIGRKAAQDLIALLGASAFMIDRQQTVRSVEPPAPRKRKTTTTEVVERIEPVIERPEAPITEPEPLKLDPIQNLDVSIFDQLGKLDDSAAEAFFDLDKLEELVNSSSGRKEITLDEAIELGVLGNIDGESR